MREVNLTLDTFDVLSIISYSATHEINQHGRAFIRAIIEDKKENEYMDKAEKNKWIKVEAFDEDDRKSIIFCGVIENLKFLKESGSSVMELQLVTGSALMEEKIRTRSFQGSNTYENILEICKNEYEDAYYIVGDEQDKAISDFLVQYKENDWEFIKRIAKLKETALIPDCQTKGVKYFFGIPKRIEKKLISTDILLVMKREYSLYEVGSREIFGLGDRVSFNKKSYYIIKVESKTIGSELYHTYHLINNIEHIIKKESRYNYKIIGASLTARITGVENSKVMISIDEDSLKKTGKNKWFDFSTIYSSSNGAGWYCMPEIEDTVRLYFPTENEGDAYVCSAVHKGDGGGIRNNPDNKIWRNKYGKEIRLSKDKIAITSNKGDYIEISDNEGVKIVSSGSINIKAKDRLEISSEEASISIAAGKRIFILQEDTQIVLKDGISVSGEGVNIS